MNSETLDVPNPTDLHVGQRLRLRRTLLGLSQEKLALSVGLTFQQVQKYERGTNRVSASRLYELAQALEVDVGFFFADMPVAGLAEEPAPYAAPSPSSRETLELVRLFSSVQDAEVRKKILAVVRSIAQSVNPDKKPEDEKTG